MDPAVSLHDQSCLPRRDPLNTLLVLDALQPCVLFIIPLVNRFEVLPVKDDSSPGGGFNYRRNVVEPEVDSEVLVRVKVFGPGGNGITELDPVSLPVVDGEDRDLPGLVRLDAERDRELQLLSRQAVLLFEHVGNAEHDGPVADRETRPGVRQFVSPVIGEVLRGSGVVLQLPDSISREQHKIALVCLFHRPESLLGDIVVQQAEVLVRPGLGVVAEVLVGGRFLPGEREVRANEDLDL